MRASRARTLAAVLALIAAGVVLVVSVRVFPHHSINHDEAVYLQQAAMLARGQLVLRPPVPEAFRPWFFVAEGGRFYPRYAPVPAALFALGGALGSERLALAGVAAAAVALGYAATAEAFDRRTGLFAALFLLSAPLFLVDAAVFLPYVPTATMNLAFAWAYLRADRLGDRRWAALAGSAIGLSFFARPYTAVLFAAPFVVHALLAIRASGADRRVIERLGTVALLGLVGVGLALAYNAHLTGSPLRFPYEAFAPRDGLGFGRRALLGYERIYSPALALRANAEVVGLLFLRWVPGGLLGTALALVGLACIGRGTVDTSGPSAGALLLAGLFPAVLVGNVYWWGNLNILGALGDPADGFIRYLGPYYHVDLLLPTAAFAAHGTTRIAEAAGAGLLPGPDGRARRAATIGMVALVLGASLVAVAGPLADDRSISRAFEEAYEPAEAVPSDHAIVFVPPIQGPWLNHPFQPLRNPPTYDGPVLYALDGPGDPFAVVDAFPERDVYRFRVAGSWAPGTMHTVETDLQPVRVVEGDRVRLRVVAGLPAGSDRVSVRLASPNGHTYVAGPAAGRSVALELLVTGDGVRLSGPGLEPVGEARTIPIVSGEPLTVEVNVAGEPGAGFSYRLVLPVESLDGNVRAMTPRTAVCRVPLRCDPAAVTTTDPVGGGTFVGTSLTADDG